LKTFKFAPIPTVVASLTVSGCDGSPHKVCVDPATRFRVDDSRCRDGSGYHGGGVGGGGRGSSNGSGSYNWYYMRPDVRAPSVGEAAGSVGSFTPSPGVSYSSAPAVSRGNFKTLHSPSNTSAFVPHIVT